MASMATYQIIRPEMTEKPQGVLSPENCRVLTTVKINIVYTREIKAGVVLLCFFLSKIREEERTFFNFCDTQLMSI